MSMPPPIQPPPMSAQPGGVPVPNHLVWAIVITIVSLCLCCIIGTIPGIVAIVFASKVNGALDRGDFAEARRSSDTAKLWCWITTGLCALGLLVNIGIMASGGMASYQQRLQQIQQMQQHR
ncbi:CD225/dispanin family protein [Cognatilysobacter lacus]|uniref:CD225/dispanin family protein n=1 Tax=Cognatilysobacter lacus TaxID=1643323 RepID=A0A5D8Z7M0_9GAMM|nr:CD225/dispanin family protein [Lysobacter lacus]TZF90690.1 CD225/dispanin family protein [Lysobacter lacus]